MSGVPERKFEPLSDKDDKSVQILNYVAGAYSFSPDPEDPTMVRFYFDEPGKLVLNPGGAYPVTEFLDAVRFFRKNRELMSGVMSKMRDPYGSVKVFDPNNRERTVALIPSYQVLPLYELSLDLSLRDDS